MIEQYSPEEFKRFAKGIKSASDILRTKKPDYIFAPIVGAVPFIDLLCIADRHFNLDAVEYLPNSSRFINREELMLKWYSNFLNKEYHGQRINAICVDEVISGASAVKGEQEFRRALYKFSGGDKRLEKNISYFVLGIGEQPENNNRNPAINRLVNKNRAKIIEVGNIITADNPDLNPVRLRVAKKKNAQGRNVYLPEIERWEVSEHYLTLLQNFAAFMGADPAKVSISTMGRIRGSLDKYLSD